MDLKLFGDKIFVNESKLKKQSVLRRNSLTALIPVPWKMNTLLLLAARATITGLLMDLAIALRFSAVPQISVPLVERMPNSPTPFSPPDWKQKAADYTVNVFDATSKVRGSFSIMHQPQQHSIRTATP